MSEWQPIETAPHNVDVLLYCPERGVSNPRRIELGAASGGWRRAGSSTMWRHSWATHWHPLPEMPEAEQTQTATPDENISAPSAKPFWLSEVIDPKD